MKKIWMGVALTFVAHAAFAAIQFEFIQTSRSDSDSMPPMDLSAKAILDGSKSRVDFLSGNAYPPGTYVVSIDGARRLHFVDPAQKSYTEVDTRNIASAIGMSNIQITNLKSSVSKLEDQQIIAGIPADHYRLTMTFDITVTFKNRPLKQTVRTEIDKWTTVQFGDLTDDVTSKTLLTGNRQIDDLVAAETTKITGFPLRQTVRITAINATTVGRPVKNSELKVPSTVTLTREMTVTSIRETRSDEKMFAVPAGYTRTDFAERVPKPQTQVLSLEPSSN